jgi:hypothetical protein
MYDRLELPQCGWIAQNPAGKLDPVNTAVDTRAWKCPVDCCNSFSFVQRMYNGIRIEHRHTQLSKEAGRRTFTHSD